jgi:hypothetical protein
MPAVPQVQITVVDNGASAALSVPQQNVQLKIGISPGAGPAPIGQFLATSSPTTLQTSLMGGQLLEAAGLVTVLGNIVVAMVVPFTVEGKVWVAGTPTAASASPVSLTGIGSSYATTGGNLTVMTDPTVCPANVQNGYSTKNGAWDALYAVVQCVQGGTIGASPPPMVRVSYDAGRNYGPPIAVPSTGVVIFGTSNASPNYWNPPLPGMTGVGVTFAAGTMALGDQWTFGTTPPHWTNADITIALATFQASQFGVAGVGSVHVVGTCNASGSDDINAIQTQVQAGTTTYIYNRAIVELDDASPPVLYGGSGETVLAWETRIAADVAGDANQPRVCADGGFYNTPTPFANSSAGAPSYRRPLAWSHAAKRTAIGPQRRAGRVLDGAYPQISPALTPDGFIYFDSRTDLTLNNARIGTAMTWPKKGQGFFQCQEPLLSAPGSQFVELAIGNVLDIACDIGYAAGVDEVSDDLTTQANGTLYPTNLNMLQGDVQNALNEGMIQTPLVSAVTATIPPTYNVQANGTVPINIAVQARVYVNKVAENVTLVQPVNIPTGGNS